MNSPTAQQIEIAVAKHFGYRQNLIVPNVYWGIGLHYEADLVVLRPSDWAIEVEIKVSAADIKADLSKRRQHDSNLFCALYFAVPESLADNANIPAHAGILSVYWRDLRGWRVKKIRDATRRKTARKWTPETRRKLYELAAMRIWSLKEHLSNARERKSV
jgi:hypothetical protein